jgi:light-regulated signal transduction histidine kinase (bacteriophytochrome)
MKKSLRSSTTSVTGETSLPGSHDRRGEVPSAPMDVSSRITALEGEVALYRHAWEKAREEMQAFAYSVSHDLRAPIRAIEGFSKILLEDYAKELNPDARNFLTHIIDNTQQLSSQVEDLLKYYRLGKNVPQKVSVNVENLVREALADQPMPLPGDLSISIQPLGVAIADPLQLRHAFSQLIANSIKYRQANTTSKIEIGSRSDANSTTFFVKDNGVGFDMQYASRLFQVFQKLHSPHEYPGNGIGLAIVKRIVEAHGGCVWAESQPDNGSTFYFTLPGTSSQNTIGNSRSIPSPNSQKTA